MLLFLIASVFIKTTERIFCFEYGEIIFSIFNLFLYLLRIVSGSLFSMKCFTSYFFDILIFNFVLLILKHMCKFTYMNCMA